MKRFISCMVIIMLCIPLTIAAVPEVPVPSMILIERDSGMVLAEKNADERLSPASITKVMTLLLTAEAVDSGSLKLTDTVSISLESQNMGGSTAFLEQGETYTLEEIIKAVSIQSANDGAVALAEHIAGSQQGFVDLMNERAAQLGMKNTHFKNCHGLDDDDHYSSARDIGIMSAELLKHDFIKNYTTIWMDTLRSGTFTLSNTNRLVKFYEGATGLKTGSTSKAGACISASAKRNGMEIIAVVLHAANTNDRFESARKMLDYGFANYSAVEIFPENIPTPISVLLGRQSEIQPIMQSNSKIVVEKSKIANITKVLEMTENVNAPVEKGQKLGELKVYNGTELIATMPMVAAENVEKVSWGNIFSKLLGNLFMAG